LLGFACNTESKKQNPGLSRQGAGLPVGSTWLAVAGGLHRQGINLRSKRLTWDLGEKRTKENWLK